MWWFESVVVIHSLAVNAVPGRVTPEKPEGADVIVLVIAAVPLMELPPPVELAIVIPLALSVPEVLSRLPDVLVTETSIAVVELATMVPLEVAVKVVCGLAVMTRLDDVAELLEVIEPTEDDPKLVIGMAEEDPRPVVGFTLGSTVELAIVVGLVKLDVDAVVLMLALLEIPDVELFPGKKEGSGSIGSPFEAVGMVQPIPLGLIS